MGVIQLTAQKTGCYDDVDVRARREFPRMRQKKRSEVIDPYHSPEKGTNPQSSIGLYVSGPFTVVPAVPVV
jgi:hypothetical protein